MGSLLGAAELLRKIAVPRLAGSAERRQVGATVARHLERLGYSVRSESFDTGPRKLIAVAAVGAGIGWAAFLLFPLLVFPVAGWAVVLVGVGALVLVALVGVGVAAGYLPVSQTVQARNLVATKGAAALWLVAHADSKGQALSLRGRVVAVVAAAVGVVALVACLGFRIVGPLSWWVAGPATALTVVAGAALARGKVRNDSPGAVDNATGVIAALVAAERLRDRSDVGVLITDAEEFGMEGARAWIRTNSPHGWFVNFDGIDGRGRYRVMLHGRRHRRFERGGRLEWAITDAFERDGHAVVRGSLPPGVLVDGVALAAAGMRGVTVSRGDWATLGIVHTRADTPERTSVWPAIVAGKAVGDAVSLLLG